MMVENAVLENIPADMQELNKSDKPLSPDLLRKINAYWRAANYVSVGQIYLYDNPLLKEPLKLSHVKPLVVALGHDAGPELHLCAFEPGHQEIRPGYVLYRRSRSRRSGDCR